MKIADMHCDTISEIVYSKQRIEDKKRSQNTSQNTSQVDEQPIELKKNKLHLDLEKMKAGDYLVQNFAMYVNLKERKEPLDWCLRLMDTFYEEMDKNKDTILLATSYSDIIKNQQAGKMSALLTIEEGGVAKGKLENLRMLYRLGVRMLTLTWNFENELGFPNAITPSGERAYRTNPNTVNGLKEKGIEFVQEMERIGMIIDVSHLSDAGFYDVLKYTKKPFVASHSNARSVCNHIRNMSDDMIRCLANRGGVMGINFEPDFLQEFKDGETAHGNIELIIRQIKHIINIGGYECLGLGSDFDGISTNDDLKDGSCMPLLEQALRNEGISEEIIESIFYKNVLRVYQEILG